MSIGAVDTSLQQLTSVGLTSTAPTRPQSVTDLSSQMAERQNPTGVLLVNDGAEKAAERLGYDQPSGRQGRATYAYESVSRQEKREQLQQMLRVDLYA